MLVKLNKQEVKTKIIPETRRVNGDWKKLQQQLVGFSDIKADAIVKRFVDASNFGFDVEYANVDNKKHVNESNKVGNNFFIITTQEFSKKSLKEIKHIIGQKMETATVGGYVSLLSYYMNCRDIEVEKTMPDIFSNAVDSWIKTIPYRTENVSAIIDYPILKYERPNYHEDSHGLFEGKNFLFSHPNVRFWLWK